MSDLIERWERIIHAEKYGMELTTEAYVAIAEDTIAALRSQHEKDEELNIYVGFGAPTFEAPSGSMYIRQDPASAATVLYVTHDDGTWKGRQL